MKKICEFLREHVVKKVNFKKKKMVFFTNEQKELNGNAEICYIH